MSLTRTQIESGPQPDNLLTGTDMLVPDIDVNTRLGHFDAEIYDLRETSHLSRFLRVLLGDAGAGGLHKSGLVNRLRNAMQSTHFLDLDRFYGALFGVHRRIDEIMPIDPETKSPLNPHTATADADTWDEIQKRDAAFRERIIRFSRAIPLGGTLPGIKAAAEALLDCPVQIYESWTLLDQLVPNGDGTYTTPPASVVGVGRMPIGNRSEVVIRPSRAISPEEHSDLLRVLSRLKPMGISISLGAGVRTRIEMQPRNAAADSEFWELRKQTPNRTVPPFSETSGARMSYVGSVTAMRSYSSEDGYQINESSHHLSTSVSGATTVHSPDRALVSTTAAEGGIASLDGSVVSHPYAADTPPSMDGAP